MSSPAFCPFHTQKYYFNCNIFEAPNRPSPPVSVTKFLKMITLCFGNNTTCFVWYGPCAGRTDMMSLGMGARTHIDPASVVQICSEEGIFECPILPIRHQLVFLLFILFP